MSQIRTSEDSAMFIVNLPAELSQNMLETFEVEMKTWLLSPKLTHVLDFENVQKISPIVYKGIVLYNKALRATKKNLYCVNLKESLAQQIRAAGLADILTDGESYEKIKKSSLIKKPNLDVKLINPFIDATQNVLQTQANTKVVAGKPYVKKGDDPFPIEIAGLISLNSGDSFKGSVVICFQAKTFLAIYSNMVGEPAPEITAEIQDGAGELINIIYGQAKTVLNDQYGQKLGLALPTVLVGERLKIRHQSRESSIIVPFECSCGPMFIEILMEAINGG